jgi:hypothetical protein
MEQWLVEAKTSCRSVLFEAFDNNPTSKIIPELQIARQHL